MLHMFYFLFCKLELLLLSLPRYSRVCLLQDKYIWISIATACLGYLPTCRKKKICVVCNQLYSGSLEKTVYPSRIDSDSMSSMESLSKISGT